MLVDSIFKAAGNLLIITAINAVVIFGLTFAYLCIRDKVANRERIVEKSKRK
jgi:uncharacterized protein (DUF697 family)